MRHRFLTADVFTDRIFGGNQLAVLPDGRPVSARLRAPRPPEFGPPAPARADLAAMLSLDEADVLDAPNGPQAVSCGLPFLFIPLRDRGAVGRARLRLDVWERVLARS